MPRLERRSAGDKVQARAERLSDELLVEEHGTFALFEVAFAERYPNALRQVESAYRRGLELALRDSRMTERVQGIVESACSDATDAMSDLLVRASEMVLESMATELTYCEQTLAQKYKGVAMRGVQAATMAAPAMRDQSLDRFREKTVQTVLWWRGDWTDALRFAVMNKEPMEVLERRLFSTEPLRGVLGHSGRGVWWRPPGSLSRWAREVEFDLVNEIRTMAIARMNEAADARR